MNTIALYDSDSHLRAFDAQVLRCEPADGGWAVVLDRTAFFPEGGGQGADHGTLSAVPVRDVQISGGEIVHFTAQPLPVGATVRGELDWARRFRHMQNHSGEHIVSGILHRLYGVDNVGFHLGAADVTIDLNGELTRAQLDDAEVRANAAVTANLPVIAEYPDPARLAAMTYRSKLDLTEHVRIVTIGDVDCCACCAPHVAFTGEIGAVKLLDFARFRGGVRIHMQCGADAMADYREKYASVAQISAMLSAKQPEVAAAVQQLLDTLQAEKHTVVELKKQLARAQAESIPVTDGAVCCFADGDSDTLREMVNIGMARCALCGAFCGDDDHGYRYILGSRAVDLRALAPAFHAALCGRGGGRPEMIQGTVAAGRGEIERWFAAFRAE